MPNSEAWRRPVDNVVYSVRFTDELTDELAAHHAKRLLAKPTVTLTQQEQYDALAHALADGHDLGANISPPHSDEQLRLFLSKVVVEMDRQWPWTEPPLRQLPLNRWSDFTDAHPVAALRLSRSDVMECLRHGFVPAPDDGRGICLLALASGTEIVLVDDYWPETGNMAVLTHATEPRQVTEYLVANTELTEDDLRPVEAELTAEPRPAASPGGFLRRLVRPRRRRESQERSAPRNSRRKSKSRSPEWRPPVDGLIYCVQFADELDDELAAVQAQRLLDKPVDVFTQQEQYDALVHGLTVDDDLGARIPQPHSDEQLRLFLSKVVAEMDRRRPWTEPALRPLPLDRWNDLARATPIATLTMPFRDVHQRLHHVHRSAPEDGRRICLLALAGGAEIALAADWWPESGNIAVLSHSDPEHVVEYLLTNTILTENELTPIR